MKLRGLALACLGAVAFTGCGESAGDVAVDEQVGVSEAAATATRIYATEASLELSFETMGTFETREGVRSLILHATANRYLQNVFSFVPDDAFGKANIISERRFEVVLPEGHELNSILSGLPLFISVNTFTGTPTSYTAKIEVFPRFFDFRGASSVYIEEAVDPVYVVHGGDNLIYRGRANVLADSLAVSAEDGIPQVSRVDADTFKLDWTYTAVKQAMDPHTTPLTFTASTAGGQSVQKTARLVARVTSLALTTDDPYQVWPSPPCLPEVYTCIHSKPAGTTDFGDCGSNRQVSRCMYVANLCEVSPAAALSLTPVDASSLSPAIAAWNAGSNNGAWHHLEPIDAYSTPACTNPPATIQAVMEEVHGGLSQQYQGFPAIEDGVFTNRAGLSQSVFFENGYYGNGVALLAAIDAYAGGGNVQAWIADYEVPCHNCHQFNKVAVLFYPSSGKVLVLQGYTGYDS
ncbi:hypothetical protein LZ198_31770 [Myxococcus sp. K15C18031901]|uniref:hypothetical protein n=1 Tax=Myxococcus dinghuensis TaxID=2906761 RepID=UPI0020A7BD23|nr:hypothetical protein [Myxococcus dinghuensis]MCP3103472.1 hypothetical protein [Myxococcus dinghuensis]